MWEYRAKILKVVDGDTFYAEVDLGFYISVKLEFRLNKIDAPELKTSKGKEVKEFVKNLIEGKEVIITTRKKEGYKKEKYGRWIADVLLDDGNYLSDLLLEKNLAVQYKIKEEEEK